MLRIIFLILLHPLLSSAQTQDDSGLQSVESIKTAVETYLTERMTGDGIRIVARAKLPDSRLHLAACEVPLQLTVSNDSAAGSRPTVVVHCPGSSEWNLRVTAQLQRFRMVLVSNRSLARGDVITAADVKLEERDVTQLAYGYVANVAELERAHLQRPIVTGTVIIPPLLTPRHWVRIGDQVTVISTVGPVEVRANGTALENGVAGSRVKVRNLSSGRVLEATVNAPGVVQISP